MTDTTFLAVDPERCAVFGADASTDPDVAFCLVTVPDWVDRLAAPGTLMRRWEPGEDLADVVASLPEPAHVLVAAPGRLVTSPEPEQLGRRKLVCFAAGSTPMPFDAFAHFLHAFEQTDPAALERRAETVFTALEATDHLEIVDDRYGTTATFDHLADDYAWNQQAGFVDWGEQQMAPGGELSVLPADVMAFDDTARLALDGQLALRGTPIVHGGRAPYALDDQERRYQALSTLADHAVVVSVEQGEIVDHQATDPAAQPAADALAELFDDDPRYRVVLEVGFGINGDVAVQPGNRAMNEVHGGRDGIVHFGVGLTPDTTYAPIVLCPGSTVRTAEGGFVVGARNRTRRLNRVKSPSCGC